ncbi:hypothetical protein EDD16DRAFT_1234775 [Pisolithus croceorrhizus]|nr:hypothetical protein EDD16DRAFT_1234775 [Pisolithus croceorrhizus]
MRGANTSSGRIRCQMGQAVGTPSTIQHPPQSPMSKRLRDIEKGLQERHENRIVTADHSSTVGEELPVQQALPLSLTSGSSSSTDQERELPPSPPKQVPRRSFLGLDSPVMTPAEVPAVPDSPPSQNRSSGLGSSMLLTPPKTVHRSTSGFVFVDVGEPISPTANKGKGRAVDDSIGGSTENEENPFFEKQPASNVVALADSVPNLLKFHPASSSGSPTPGEQFVTVFNRVKVAQEELHTNMKQLQEMEVTNYILKTERQKNSFKFSNDAKAERIAELTAQVDALKKEVHE